MATTETEMIAYVRGSLGGNVTDLELTATDLSLCIAKAKMWYAMLIGQVNSAVIQVQGSTNEYAVPDDCDTVVEVAFSAPSEGSFWGWPLPSYNMTSMMSRSGTNAGTRSLMVTDVTQALQYMELVQRTASMDNDWHYDEARRLLVITPNGKDVTAVRIWYLSGTVDVTRLKIYEASLVQDYALAHAMEILGKIRTKYSEVPSSMGSTTLNGDLLAADAVALKQSLTEQLRALQPPALFITG